MGKTGLLEGIGEEYTRHNTAILLENQAKQLISEYLGDRLIALGYEKNNNWGADYILDKSTEFNKISEIFNVINTKNIKLIKI